MIAALRIPRISLVATLGAALLLALLIGAGPADAKAGKPRLKVTSTSNPPPTVEAGERVRIEATVANRGRKAAPAQLKLLAEMPNDGVKRLKRRRSKRIQPGSELTTGLRFRVPAELVPPDSTGAPANVAGYPLEVCVRKRGPGSRFRCKGLRRPLKVEGEIGLPAGYSAGSRSLDDPLFPQVGNGGYDVSGYDISLDYDPSRNRFKAGTHTKITAVAKKNLSRFSLDFQRLDVSAVKVNGAPAGFSQVAATPPLGGAANTTQLRKLVIDPGSGIDSGTEFTARVAYSGTPKEMVDADGSSEGWVRACLGVPSTLTCDGAFVVNEPNGAQTWFPSNNHPSDKATIDTEITVPAGYTAIGVGELLSNNASGDGSRTWSWTEDDPTATYLTTATVGDFIFTEATMTETGTGLELPVYEAIDSDATIVQQNSINTSLDRAPSMINFLAGLYGPYPFDSTGAVVDQVPTLGYALEVQTKPHFATLSVPVNTLLHEHAHQWFGNAVSPATWLEIWHNEGWAEWSTWYWDSETNGDADSPADIFASEYDGASASEWETPPATLDGDPAKLFDEFAVYVRSAMTLEAYREIVGDSKFFDFARTLQTRYSGGDVSTAQVIDTAKEISDFSGPELQLLDDFFQQWLYGTVKPTILPPDFPA